VLLRGTKRKIRDLERSLPTLALQKTKNGESLQSIETLRRYYQSVAQSGKLTPAHWAETNAIDIETEAIA
jgi:hypothetical protein